MSGSGGGSSSTQRSNVPPTRRPTRGGENGQNGGESRDPCDIIEVTTLNSPNRTVVTTLRDGDVLAIELRDERRLLAMHGNRVAGSVTSTSHPRILQCMQRGSEYVAIVLSVRGGACDVRIQPK